MEKDKIIKFPTHQRPKNIQINDLATFFCGEKKVIYINIQSDDEGIRSIYGEIKKQIKSLKILS